MLEQSTVGKTDHWGITRLANACTILEVADAKILTDPWFSRNDRFFSEYSPIQAGELPELDAIIGGHWVKDHFDAKALQSYRFKDTTPVYVSDESMAKKATKVGFTKVEVMPWGETRAITDQVTLESVEEHIGRGRTSSNYGIVSDDVRFFFAPEALDLDAARRYAETTEPYDVVMGPVNGVHIMGKQLTVTAAEMIEITKMLKAPKFVVFHDSHKPLMGMIKIASSAKNIADVDTTGIEIIELEVGNHYTATVS